MFNLFRPIIDRLRKMVPTTIETRFDNRAMLPALAHQLDVSTVHETFRSAENGQPERLFALYRDIIIAHAHLQGRFADRKRAVLGDQVSLQAFDKKSLADVEATDAVWPLTRHKDWLAACNHLLDSTLYPVAVVEKVYEPSQALGTSYRLKRLIPVPHDLLEFSSGELRIRETNKDGRPTNTYHPPDPRRYIVHRGHLLTTPDHWGGPLRSLVLWYLLGMMGREWWARFLDRYGSPFVVGKYMEGDKASRSVLQRAFAWATKIGGLVVTSDTQIELKQAAASDSGTAFQTFHDVANREISKLILGQTLSADAQATGMGSGVAGAQDSVRQDIRQFDALLLGNTLRNQLVDQFLQINGYIGAAPTIVWGAISPEEQKAHAELLTALKTAGLRLTDDGITELSERMSLSLERDQTPTPTNPFLPFGGIHTFSTDLQELDRPSVTAAARLAHALGRHHAPIVQLIRTSTSKEDCMAKVETYAANLEQGEAARVIEEVLLSYAANGAAHHAQN